MGQFKSQKNAVEEMLLDGLSRIGMALRSESWNLSAKESLNPTQFQVMTLVNKSTHPLTVTELAEKIGVTKASLSDTVSALESKGFLKKKKSETDQRSSHLHLTASGKKIMDRLKGWPEEMIQSLEHFNDQEKGQFLSLISKLIQGLQEQGKIAPAKMCFNCKYFKPQAYPGQKKPHHCDFIKSPIAEHDLRLDCDEYEVIENLTQKI